MESLNELGIHVKEMARKASPPDSQEEEALSDLKMALPMDLERTVVIQRYGTINKCIQHLQQFEALKEAMRQARKGKVHQVASEVAQTPSKEGDS